MKKTSGIIGGAAAAVAVAAVLKNLLPDIMRYLRIRTM
ncbi:DUF6893 family small protein [Streptomyces sp. FIT100]